MTNSNITLEVGKPLTARELSSELGGTFEERMTEEKTILLKMIPGKRPEIVFTGFWNGKFIKAAMNSISKAYRLRRYKSRRPYATSGIGTKEPSMGEGKKEEGNG